VVKKPKCAASIPWILLGQPWQSRHWPKARLHSGGYGATDYVSDGKDVYALRRGHEWLTLLSGSGCYVGTMMAAYMSVTEPLIAAMTALALMSVASEVAAMKSDGPGTFRANLLISFTIFP